MEGSRKSWRRVLWIGVRGTGIGAIALSLVFGSVTLVLQVLALIRTGEWTNYGARDLNHYLGLQTPITISKHDFINDLWGAFLRDGSLALAFLMYVPVLLLIFGYFISFIVTDPQEPID